MSTPFLPEPEVIAAPRPKTNAKRTLALWVVLIVMFLTIWQFLTPDTRDNHAINPPPHVEATSPFWSSTTVMLVPVAVVAIMFFLFIRAYRQNGDYQLALEPGRMALAQRRFSDAVEIFRALVPRFAKQPGYRAATVLNVAEAQLRAGRLSDALASCAEIERSRLFVLGTGLRLRVATLTAFAFGLRGDVAVAERWISDARVRLAKNRDDRMGHAAQLCLAEAVVACRKEEHANAVATLEKSWNELRFALNADSMRTVEVVRAFAEAQAGVRASNTVAERLVRVEPVAPGELAFLGVEWPEMQAFLGAHGIGT